MITIYKEGGVYMNKEYDNWWLENSNGDQEMEDSHQRGWENVMALIDEKDILNKDILDFGCNQGKFLRLIFDKTSFNRGYGIDIAKNAIHIAKLRVGNYPIHYTQAEDARTLNKSFHTVISTSVLYLIDDLDAHFKMIFDVLHKKGVYYASFADQTNNPSFKFMKEKIDRYGATKMQGKTLTEVVDTLIKNNFSVELIKEYREPSYDVTNYKDFHLSVDDFILSCNSSFLIKAVKKGDFSL